MSSNRITTSQELAKYLQDNALSVAALTSDDGQSKPGGWWRMRLAGGDAGRMVVHFDRAGRSQAWLYLDDLVCWAQAKGNLARFEAPLAGMTYASGSSGYMDLRWAARPLVQTPPAPYHAERTELTVNDHPVLVGATGVAMHASADRMSPAVKVTAKASAQYFPQDVRHVSVHFLLQPDRGGARALNLTATLGNGVGQEATRTLAVPCSYKSRKGELRSGLVSVTLGIFVPRVTSPVTAATA